MDGRIALLFGSNCEVTDQFGALLEVVGIPGRTLEEVDRELQLRFFKKNNDGSPMERWEFPAGDPPAGELRTLLATCGFINETRPQQEWYRHAPWPGALVTRAGARLMDFAKAWSAGVRWNDVIAAGGKRELRPEQENWRTACQALGITPDTVDTHSGVPHGCREEDIWAVFNPQTELQMMKALWEMAHLPNDLKALPLVSVDAPMKPPAKEGGPPVRPNTEDTIRTWLETNPVPGPVLVSSGAPYGMAQHVAFLKLLEPYGFTVETFGHEAPAHLTTDQIMREVAGCVHRILDYLPRAA